MSIDSRKGSDDTELVISISGKFDFNSVQDFRKSYTSVAGVTKFVIDMSRVEHIDSSALGMLLNMQKHVGEGTSIVISNCRPTIKKIFLISRFDKKFLFV